jgi:hypothetical protein
MRCQLELGHEGPHLESFIRDGKISITWEKDETTFEERWILAHKETLLKDHLNILNDCDNSYMFVVDILSENIIYILPNDEVCPADFDNDNVEFIWRNTIKRLLHENGYI